MRRSAQRTQAMGGAIPPFIRYQCALLGERAELLPWSGIENRAVDFAGCVANESDPRMIAALDVEFIPRKNCHRHGLALVKIKDRPASARINDQLAIRNTDLKLDTALGDRLPRKGDDERIVLRLPDDLEFDPDVDRT